MSVAEVNLKLIWDVVSQIKVGEHGQAYVVDAQGRLIAHPDISLVLRNTDMTRLPQVQAARAAGSTGAREQVQEAEDIRGRKVLTAYAPVAPLGWLVFVELPIEEAYAPLYDSIKRSGVLLLAGLLLAFLAGLFLARKMVVPIQALAGRRRAHRRAAISRQRISIKTGDELEGLADQFNDMAGKLQESYADLEQKVEDAHPRAGAIGRRAARARRGQPGGQLDARPRNRARTPSSPRRCSSPAPRPARSTCSTSASERIRAARHLRHGRGDDRGADRDHHIGIGDAGIGEAAAQREPVADRRPARRAVVRVIEVVMLRAGYPRALVVPLLGADDVVGALVVRRKAPGEFPKSTVDLLQTFAAQSVLAIQNARLFSEIDEKSRQLEVASQHKSQFLANMSHELRTPLNAILGYTELILDDIYGEMPEKMRGVLERVQTNGKHLLGLINDVLDLSKIEAGQLTLSLADYSIKDVVHSVLRRGRVARHRKEARAQDRGAAGSAGGARRRAPPDAGAAQSGRQRHQVHRQGRGGDQGVGGEWIVHASRCATPGRASPRPISSKIFEEFQQADSSATKKKGGTGLGLSIAKRIVEMHGGRIWVESELGRGLDLLLHGSGQRRTTGGAMHDEAHPGGRGPGGQPADPARSARQRRLRDDRGGERRGGARLPRQRSGRT